MTLLFSIGSLFLCFLMSWGATILVRRFLISKAILDLPNERSSHTIPTPRGGGIAVTGLSLFIWTTFTLVNDLPVFWIPIAAALVLALISWADDLISLSAGKRLILQLLATFVGFYWISTTGSITNGLVPLWAEWIFFSLAWTGFLNFFNFMDGIDGISGVETITIGLGLFAALGFSLSFDSIGIIGLYMAVIALGFLILNWHPAKIFLGDVGSVPLGYLLGGLLLYLAASNLWAAAIILPLYYFMDAGITLLRRLLRGEKIWQAHKEHYYQQATQKGHSHSQVSIAIALTNISLIGMACYSITAPFIAIGISVISVTILLLWMKK